MLGAPILLAHIFLLSQCAESRRSDSQIRQTPAFIILNEDGSILNKGASRCSRDLPPHAPGAARR